MATATPTRTRTRKAPAKAAPPPVVEEVEEDLPEEEELVEDDLEELEEDEVQEAPSKRASSAKARAASQVTFGMIHVADYLSKKTGKTVTTRELRGLARRLAREDKPRIDREIIAGNRTRYDWSDGLKNPEVKALIKAYLGGEGEIEKNEKLQALKDKKAAERAAKADSSETAAAPKKRGRPAKAKVVEVVEEDDEELDFDEDDE